MLRLLYAECLDQTQISHYAQINLVSLLYLRTELEGRYEIYVGVLWDMVCIQATRDNANICDNALST
jgi:hypothetical protein